MNNDAFDNNNEDINWLLAELLDDESIINYTHDSDDDYTNTKTSISAADEQHIFSEDFSQRETQQDNEIKPYIEVPSSREIVSDGLPVSEIEIEPSLLIAYPGVSVPPDPLIEKRDKIKKWLEDLTKKLNPEKRRLKKTDIDEVLKKIKAGVAIEEAPKPYKPDPASEPENHPFVITFNQTRLLPWGGLGVITGGTGVGKSSLISGIAALVENPECDGFSFSVSLPEGKKVLILDTELQKYVLWQRMKSCCKRAQVEKLERVEFWGLRGMNNEDANRLLDEALKDQTYGLVIIDCISDFCPDFNNIEASNSLVQRLLMASTETGVSILVTIHDNPVTSKYQVAGKARGHLGTMLPQKADMALYIKNVVNQPGVFCITNDFQFSKTRHGPGREVNSFFTWDKDLLMHVSCDYEEEQKDLDSKLLRNLSALFKDRETWTRQDFIEYTKAHEEINDAAVSKRWTRLLKRGCFINIGGKKYSINGALLTEHLVEI